MMDKPALFRKARRVLTDPVLRRWMVGRATGRWAGEAPSKPRRPPYLDPLQAAAPPPIRSTFSDLAEGPPETALELMLAGERVRLAPGEARALMDRGFADTESLLALHRFAWIPLAGDAVDVAWVDALWRAWMDRFGTPEEGWAWHPYTVAERLVNVLNFARRHGLPGPRGMTLHILARHGPAILQRLEYYGAAHTGNHLANNGRGLFLGGLHLGLKSWAHTGGRILCEEAKHLFLPSGFLREGSSHYHLLVTRWYAECWLAARRFARAECPALEETTRRALSVLPVLDLPAGMPLIGDLSPDCPPDYLGGLLRDENKGWLNGLEEDERRALEQLRPAPVIPRAENLAADGWHRANFHSWSMLCHVAAQGWSPMPGHGHQDCGSFELHYDQTLVFCDVGRRSYGLAGDGDVVAAAHNTLTVDGAAPFPVNRPYYCDAFRQKVTGAPPVLTQNGNEVTLETTAFSRLRNVGTWRRVWRFAEDNLVISDRIDGTGRHRVDSYLHTTLPVSSNGGEILMGPFRVTTQYPAILGAADRWTAYGQGLPATSIRYTAEVQLPWSSTIEVRRA